MTMKQMLCLSLTGLLAASSCAQNPNAPDPEWKATVKVLDEDGQPLAGAAVTIGYYVPPPPGESIGTGSKRGTTDTNGMFTASARCRSIDLSFGAGKVGYYRSHMDYELGPPFRYDVVKWSPNITLLLKKVGQPIPMYAKGVNLGMPVFDKSAGFDLMAGDWVAPYGRGVTTDILFTGHFDKRTENESDYKLTVSFPNTGDGIQEFAVPDAEKGSGLRSPHEAPADSYQSKWVQTDNRKPGKPVETNRDENRNYFFRVRTVLDEKGNVKSALYGKIYGDFMKFRYYLNPTPNSRNVEFDPKQNLLKGLKSTEQVDAP
jgi:hypothetical protein